MGDPNIKPHVPVDEAYFKKLAYRNSLIKKLYESKGSDELKVILEKEKLNYMICSIRPETYALYFMTAHLSEPHHIITFKITEEDEVLKTLEAGLLQRDIFKTIYNYDVDHFLDECMVVKFQKFTDPDSAKPESSIFKLVMPTNKGLKRLADKEPQPCSSEDIEDEEMKNLIDTFNHFNQYYCPKLSQNEHKKLKRDEPNSAKDSSTENSSVEQMDSVLSETLSTANVSSCGEEGKEHKDGSVSPKCSLNETCSTIETSTENSVDKMEEETIFSVNVEEKVPNNDDMPESYCRMFKKHKDFVSLRELMNLGDSSRVEKVKVSFSTQELFTTSNKYIAQTELQKASGRAGNETISNENEQVFF